MAKSLFLICYEENLDPIITRTKTANGELKLVTIRWGAYVMKEGCCRTKHVFLCLKFVRIND